MIAAFPAPAMGAEAVTTPERRGLTRDAVRLLVTERATGRHRDRYFRDLSALLRAGDLLVANDSATLAAALRAEHADGRSFDLHLSTHIVDELWIVEPRVTSAAEAERVDLPGGAHATLLNPLDRARPRLWYAALSLGEPFEAYLARYGRPIRYAYLQDAPPIADYQTIFARVSGSAEMPSAGRPFSAGVVAALRSARIELATITLHAGVSSPERDERPQREPFAVPAETAAAIGDARRRGGRVIAIGTTVVRALESSVEDRDVIASRGWTDLIVTRERGLAAVDGLLTGFHEPQASHLDMLRAFVDDATLSGAYAQAREGGYLWHEFGDLHLLL
jgi:S-adenosylmethionine:tRNA ribosyltransferase-isomerase